MKGNAALEIILLIIGNQISFQVLTRCFVQIDAWMLVLDELEAIFRGEKLVPHWRVRPGAGINLDKLIEAPPELDLVLWIHGSAMIPFLEEGPVSDAATWENLTSPFGSGFVQFAIWSN